MLLRFSAVAFAVTLAAAGACVRSPAQLTQRLEARRLASELRVQFTKAADASNRAVMADTDDGAASAASEARVARQTVERDVAKLESLLQSLGYTEDVRVLDGFKARFAEYRRIDDEILPLSVENSNLKAQRLSFGPAREAADAFAAALDRAAKSAGAGPSWQAQALAGHAVSAVRQIQVLHAPHIAEADAAAMTKLEERMTALDGEARAAVQQMKALVPSAGATLTDAIAALDRFGAINKELIVLSRRNSDVHSLALSLGRKRVVTANCEAQLQALEDAIGKRAFTATR